MTLHVPFTLETKHPINKEMLMKRPTRCHADQRGVPRRGARGRVA